MNLEMFLRGVMTVGVSIDGVTSADIYQGELPHLVALLVRLAVKFRTTTFSKSMC